MTKTEWIMQNAEEFFAEHEISERITVYEFGHELPVNYFKNYINSSGDTYEAVAHFGVSLLGYYNSKVFYTITYTALSRVCFDCFLSYCLGFAKLHGINIHEIKVEKAKKPHLRTMVATFKFEVSVSQE